MPQNIIKISEDELLKAACCNLSESFETNPSVDVNHNDAITGTKQIEMLGLKSPYILITEENIPMVRGASQTFGLGFTPGTWIPIDVEDFVLEKYDVFVILPWHFRNFFVRNEKFKGKTLVFPLPTPEVVVP